MRACCLALVLAVAAGCSTHPCVDTCDFFFPGHLYPNKVNPYGGACVPLGGSIQGTAPSSPYAPVVPPPVPLPPSGPPISVPTFGTAPPPPTLPPLR